MSAKSCQFKIYVRAAVFPDLKLFKLNLSRHWKKFCILLFYSCIRSTKAIAKMVRRSQSFPSVQHNARVFRFISKRWDRCHPIRCILLPLPAYRPYRGSYCNTRSSPSVYTSDQSEKWVEKKNGSLKTCTTIQTGVLISREPSNTAASSHIVMRKRSTGSHKK